MVLHGEAAVRGMVSATVVTGTLAVEFDLDGDQSEDAQASISSSGNFLFTPTTLSAGTVTVSARTRLWDSITFDFRYSDWTPLVFTYAPNESANLGIQQLSLAQDTGVFGDGITTDPSLSGKVTAPPGTQGLVVDLDWTLDGVADGTTVPNTNGTFTFVPTDLAYGSVVVAARLRSEASGAVSGTWSTLSFVYLMPANDAPVVSELAVAITSAGANGVTVVSVTGKVTKDGVVAALPVQIDLNADGIPDGFATSNYAGRFEFTSPVDASGSVTLRARAGETDSAGDSQQFGAWTAVTKALPANSFSLPSISTIELLSDTGESAADQVSANSAVVVFVEGMQAGQNVSIELDRDQNTGIDATLSLGSTNYVIYHPANASVGEQLVRARVRLTDAVTNTVILGPWQAFAYRVVADTDRAPRVVELGLTGEGAISANQATTTNPTIYGRVTDEANVSGLLVEVDLNGDGAAEATVLTDAIGRFTYSATNLAMGTHQIRFRATLPASGANQAQVGEWAQLTFALSPIQDLPPAIELFDLIDDTGAGAQLLRGRVTNDGPVAGLRVEVDYDADGLTDGVGNTDEFGYFAIRLTGLDPATTTIRARVREWNSAGEVSWSPWTSLTVAISPWDDEMEPHVAGLSLVADSGASATDRATADPRVLGFVRGAGNLAGTSVEVDSNADGQVDLTVQANAAGVFEITPSGLSEGIVTLRARVPDGPWSTFRFVLAANPDSPFAQQEAAVLADPVAEQAALELLHQQDEMRANAAYEASINQATGNYNSVVNSASAANAAATASAQAAYNSAVQQAQNSYQAALASAQTDFQTAMNSGAGGDATSHAYGYGGWYGTGGLAWPTLPSGAAGPAPPSEGPDAPSAPNIDATPFSASAVASYLTQIQQAQVAYDGEIAQHLATYNAARQTAESDYNAAVAAAQEKKTQALAAASQQAGAAPTSNPYSEAAASQQLSSAIAQADADYSAAIAQANADYEQAIQDGYGGAEEPDLAAAAAMRDQAVQQAENTFNQGNYGSGGSSYSEANNLRRNTIADANFEYGKVAAAHQRYILKIYFNAVKARTVQLAEAEKARSLAYNLANGIYAKAGVMRAAWDKNSKSYPDFQYRKNVISAEQEYKKDLAKAERDRDVALTTAEKQRAIADQQSTADFANAKEAARKAAIVAWAATQPSAIANYQTTLANLAATRTQAIQDANLSRVTEVANAIFEERKTAADAKLTFLKSVADAELARKHDKADTAYQLKSGVYAQRAETEYGTRKAERDRLDVLAEVERAYKEAVAEAERQAAHDDADVQYDIEIEIRQADRDREKEILNQDGHFTAVQAAYAAQRPRRTTISEAKETALKAAREKRANDTTGSLEEMNRIFLNEFAVDGQSQGKLQQHAEVRLAILDANFQKQIGQAQFAYTTAVAGASRTRATTAAVSDLTATTQYATALRTEATSGIDAQVAYVTGSMSDYIAEVTSWANNLNTPWSRYQLAIAQALRDQALAELTASTTYASTLAEEYFSQTTAVADSKSSFARSLADAEFAFVQSVSSERLNATNQAAQGIIYNSTELARATSKHDDAIIEANKTLETTYETSRKDHNKRVHEAWAKYWWEMGKLSARLYHLQITPNYFYSQSTTLYQTYREAEAASSVTLANELAEARKTWTDAVAPAKTTLIEELGKQIKSDATSSANRAAKLKQAEANALATRLKETAQQNAKHQKAVTAVAKQLADAIARAQKTATVASAQAERANVVAEANATSDYKNAVASQHADAVATWAAAEGTAWATYLSAIASAAVPWVQSAQNAYVQYETATADAVVSFLTSTSGLSEALSLAENEASKTYSEARIKADSDQADALIAAAKKFGDALSGQMAKHIIEVAAKDETFNNAVAKAGEAQEKAIAVAGVAYVAAAAPIQAQLYLKSDATEEVLQPIRDSIEEKRLERWGKVGQANITRVTSIADARIAWQEAVGKVDTAYTKAMATAVKSFVGSNKTAAVTRADALKTASGTYVASLTGAQKTFTTSFVTDQQTRDNALTNADKTRISSMGAADVTLATASATAEKTLAIANATQTASASAAQASSLGTLEANVQAGWAAASRDWISNVGSAVVTYRTASVQATAAFDNALATAREQLSSSYSTADVTFVNAVAPAIESRDKAIAGALATYTAKRVELDEAYKVSVVDAWEASVNASTVATVAFNKATMASRKDFDIAQAEIWKKQNTEQSVEGLAEQAERKKAKATAESTLTIGKALNKTELERLNKVAAAAKQFTIDEAAANRESVKAVAEQAKTYAHALAAADQSRTKSRAQANAKFNKAEVDAQAALDTSSAQAESSLWLAQYSQSQIVTSALDAQFNVPFLTYLKQMSIAENNAAQTIAPQYVTYRTTVAQASVTAAETAKSEYETLWTTLAEKQATFDTAMADADFVATLGRATAAETWAGKLASATLEKANKQNTAEQTYDDAIAQAKRDLVINADTKNPEELAEDDSDARAEALVDMVASYTSAETDFQKKRVTAVKAYNKTTANLTRSQAKTTANARADYSTAAIPAFETYTKAIAEAEATAAIAASNADADYVRDSSQAYRSAVQAVMTTYDSPWSLQTRLATNAWATERTTQAQAYRERQVAALEADRDRAIDEAEATAQRDLAKVEADKKQAIAAANGSYLAATTISLVGQLVLNPVTLPAPPDMNVSTLLNQMGGNNVSLNRSGGDPSDWYNKYDAQVNYGVQGDGYYDSMAMSSVSGNAPAPVDAYSGTGFVPFNRWLGDRVLRPALGDEYLASVSDTAMYTTVIGGTAVAVIVTYASAGTAPVLAGLALKGAVAGAAIGGSIALIGEAVNTYVYHENMSMDYENIIGGTVTGAVFGAVMGPLSTVLGSALGSVGSSLVAQFGVVAGKSAITALVGTGIEYAMSMGDENFSFGNAFLRNFTTDLAMAGLNTGGARIRARADALGQRAALAAGAGRATRQAVGNHLGYAAHYVTQVTGSTAIEFGWEVGLNGRDPGKAFVNSLAANMGSQAFGDVLSGEIKRRNPNLRHLPICFAAGTLVQLGTAEGEAPRFLPIEELHLGQRVQADHLTRAKREVTEPDPATWRTVKLLARKDGDTEVEITLLRPLTWLQAVQAEVGAEIPIEISEMNIATTAKVLKIGDCPKIEPGHGSVITATFRHVAKELVEVHVEGLAEPIRCTPQHPFWSVTRGEFIAASRLSVGEQLHGSQGERCQVTTVRCHQTTEAVYNVEVAGEHVYRITRHGLLVHNASDMDNVAPQETWALFDNPSQVVTVRVGELQAAIPTAQQGRITMAVAVVEDTNGMRSVLISTSEPRGYLRPGVTLKPGETMVVGTGHAEADIIDYALNNQLRVVDIGATRPVCVPCQDAISPTGANISTPLRRRPNN